VFQDSTAVPFVVVIPVLGAAVAAGPQLAGELARALLALVLVPSAGRWIPRPLLHEVAARRSPELFTLSVLPVPLAAAVAATDGPGLSLASGAPADWQRTEARLIG
jgi:CPA2 family monovalent cation:H+ antiporter-2